MVEMRATSDAQLLRDYAKRGHEAAFRELVARHTDLVYSAALRQVQSTDLAADISQSVFLDLARKAKSVAGHLSADASLVGWLYRSTRFAALTHLRHDRRRIAHERLAMEQLLTDSESAPPWEHIRPLLDAALDGLNDGDREALLLRYFKNHDFRTVGATLGISDDAAQKRVSRALERLRDYFTKRGITVGAGGLVAVIAANAVPAAPAGLAATLSATALAGTAATTSTVIAATTKTLAMTTLQKTFVTATVAVLAGAGIYEARQSTHLTIKNRVLQEQLAEAVSETGDLSNQLAEVRGTYRLTDDQLRELLRLRGEVGMLRGQLREVAERSEQDRQSHTSSPVKSASQSQQGQERSADLTNHSVHVYGLVRNPGMLAWAEGVSLKSVIDSAGGFTGPPITPNTISVMSDNGPGMTFNGIAAGDPGSLEALKAVPLSPKDRIHIYRSDHDSALPTGPEGNAPPTTK